MREFLRSFIQDSDGKFQPLYFFSTSFSFVILTGIILKYFNAFWISDTLILGMMVYIIGILTLFNKFRKRKDDKKNN